jgi:hypothetical protein
MTNSFLIKKMTPFSILLSDKLSAHLFAWQAFLKYLYATEAGKYLQHITTRNGFWQSHRAWQGRVFAVLQLPGVDFICRSGNSGIKI